MKKISIILCFISCFSFAAMAQFSLGDILSSSSKKQSEDKSTSTSIQDVLSTLGSSASSSSSSSSNDLTSALGDLLNGVVASNQELTVADLKGTWVYSEPACKFKSSDFLKSAGGDLVASQVSGKLTSLYKKLGFTSSNYRFTCQSDGDFTMKFKKVSASGSVTRASGKGNFTLEFVKLGTVSLVKVPVYVEVVGDKMVLLFETKEFVDLFKSLIGKLGISTLNKVFALTDSYDGILIGFEMTRK